MLIQNPGLEGIKLGRGHECEIRISDISVSRNHASIKLNGDGFYIYDNKSKFGTLVRNESAFDLEVGVDGKGIQIGRTFLQLQVIEKR
jgi:pSer/pThr/pTyr-binding forkhead associated (FHA) protein